MDATANKPTVLAKLLGFYTVEIRNLETGTTQAKADLLVMENLFYSQKIARTFDLKGIQGRRVKAAPHGGSVSKTLFDGDWMEGMKPMIFAPTFLSYCSSPTRSTKGIDITPPTFQVHPG